MSTAKTVTAPGAYWTQDVSVWQWHTLLHNKPGRYYIIPTNSELATMLGGLWIHFDCIVDDFGDLVRCAA